LLRSGAEAYGVLCVAKDPQTTGSRLIKSFDAQDLLQFGPLIEENGDAYATVMATVPSNGVLRSSRSGGHRGIPEGITSEDVRSALRRLAKGAPHPFGPSRNWDVLFEGRAYPPKAVVGLAAQRVTGRMLGPSDFHSGGESKCFQTLTRLGFRPVPKSGGERVADAYSRKAKSGNVKGSSQKSFHSLSLQRGQLDYKIQTYAKILKAKRTEFRLVEDYENWLRERGRVLQRNRYGNLICDAYEKETRNLIEAKSSTAREYIRTGVGQLLDYAFQGKKLYRNPKLALLLPKRPNLEELEWLRPLRIYLVWRERGAFRDNAGGRFCAASSESEPQGSHLARRPAAH
jgi:hypothetical protein